MPETLALQIAQAYNKSQKLPDPISVQDVPFSESRAREVAITFDALKRISFHPQVIFAFLLLMKEVRHQYLFAQEQGITFEPWDVTHGTQPYNTVSSVMASDVNDNAHLFFYTGGEPHPVMRWKDPVTGIPSNWMFRSVHDVFGHAAHGYQFGPVGEEKAWKTHAQMFKHNAAIRAMTTDLNGQTMWYFFMNEHIPRGQRPFATQKLNLLPARLCDWKNCNI